MLANFAIGDARLDLFGARVQLLENLGDRGVDGVLIVPSPHGRRCRFGRTHACMQNARGQTSDRAWKCRDPPIVAVSACRFTAPSLRLVL